MMEAAVESTDHRSLPGQAALSGGLDLLRAGKLLWCLVLGHREQRIGWLRAAPSLAWSAEGVVATELKIKKERKSVSPPELCTKVCQMLSQPFVKEILISEKQKTILSKVNLFNFLALLFWFDFFSQHLVSPSNMVSKYNRLCYFLALFSTFPCATGKGDSKEVVFVHSYYRPVLELVVAYKRKLSGCCCHPL